MRRKKWILGAVLIVLMASLFTLTPAETQTLGANGSMIPRCMSYVSTVREEALRKASETPGNPFLITSVSEQVREDLKSISHFTNPSIHPHFLISMQPVEAADLNDSKSRRILIICDTPYKKEHSRRPLKHAVGYSDGSAGLISTAEFKALDLSSFKRLDELFPDTASASN